MSAISRFAKYMTTLRPLIEARLADGVSATTINRTLEVARTILHRAARAYRDRDGFPWLETAPPLITMLRESPRLPHPINWDEQERIFRRLPDHLARMALFGVNTGLRDANLCGLRWSWEVPIAELGRSVFFIPAQAFKSRRAYVAILNDAAWSEKYFQNCCSHKPLLKRQRSTVYRGERIERMNNTAWQRARREAKRPNGLSVRDNRALFQTNDRDEVARLIVKGLLARFIRD